YTDDLDLDAGLILSLVETIINEHDANAHECKGRAYPISVFHRTHFKVTVTLLNRSHRDQAFTRALMDDLEARIKVELPRSCFFSLLIEYSPDYYVTNEHLVSGDDLPRYTNQKDR
ncbi:MAG: hypothetical protein AAF402_09280, partial [Pseudomonadota bacterium]